MEILPPLNHDVQTALQSAIADDLVTPSTNLPLVSSDQQADPGGHTAPGCIWDGSDSTEWSPGLWWLLNWWTSQYPAEQTDPCGVETGVHTLAESVVRIDVEDGASPGHPPPLSELGDRSDRMVPPPPPVVRDVVEQLVSRGEGIVDLLA